MESGAGTTSSADLSFVSDPGAIRYPRDNSKMKLFWNQGVFEGDAGSTRSAGG